MEEKNIKELYQDYAESYLKKLFELASKTYRYALRDCEKTSFLINQITKVINQMMTSETYFRIISQHPSLASLSWELQGNRATLAKDYKDFRKGIKISNETLATLTAFHSVRDAGLVVGYCSAVVSDAYNWRLLNMTECNHLGEIMGAEFEEDLQKKDNQDHA